MTKKELRIQEIYNNCGYTDNDQPQPMTEITDVVGATIRLHSERLEVHREEITEFLYDLPIASRRSNGTGLLCSHAHIDRHGRPWSTHEDIMINLFVLGMAINKLTFYLPLGKTSVSSCTLDTIIILFDDKK